MSIERDERLEQERFAAILDRAARCMCGIECEKPHSGFRGYDDYIKNSRSWCRFRRAVYDCYGHGCSRCGSKSRIAVHHKTYDRLGRERLEDVEPVCERCHRLIHGISPSNVDVFNQGRSEAASCQ